MGFDDVKYDEVNLEKDSVDITKGALVHVTELPSHFKSYPDNVEIYYRTYKYQEIKFLAESSIPHYNKNIMLLEGIEVKNMDKLNLTYYDYLYINFLRKLSFLNSDEYYFEYECKCNKQNKLKHNFSLTNVANFKELGVDLPITVKFNNFELEFNPITVGKYLFLLKNDLLTIRVHDTELFVNNDIAELAAMTNGNFNDNLSKLSELYTDHEEAAILDSLFALLDHGLNKYKFKCKGLVELTEEEKKLDKYKNEKFKPCGKEHDVEFLGGGLLIMPFRKHRRSTGDRIVFGKKRNS